jgi:hypothetical protein
LVGPWLITHAVGIDAIWLAVVLHRHGLVIGAEVGVVIETVVIVVVIVDVDVVVPVVDGPLVPVRRTPATDINGTVGRWVVRAAAVVHAAVTPARVVVVVIVADGSTDDHSHTKGQK